jgi:hypothetical protein
MPDGFTTSAPGGAPLKKFGPMVVCAIGPEGHTRRSKPSECV